MQKVFRNSHNCILRNADKCGINFFQLANMGNDRYFQLETRRSDGTLHNACHRRGLAGKNGLGTFIPQAKMSSQYLPG